MQAARRLAWLALVLLGLLFLVLTAFVIRNTADRFTGADFERRITPIELRLQLVERGCGGSGG